MTDGVVHTEPVKITRRVETPIAAAPVTPDGETVAAGILAGTTVLPATVSRGRRLGAVRDGDGGTLTRSLSEILAHRRRRRPDAHRTREMAHLLRSALASAQRTRPN